MADCLTGRQNPKTCNLYESLLFLLFGFALMSPVSVSQSLPSLSDTPTSVSQSLLSLSDTPTSVSQSLLSLSRTRLRFFFFFYVSLGHAYVLFLFFNVSRTRLLFFFFLMCLSDTPTLLFFKTCLSDTPTLFF